ncbi:hypothetical protein AZE42_01862 [Rhizopogon vesiculosus]|uniref:Uncharacterized protein n=1 Tax=Rhizopogon vesiculosus TaxID=180088 RepID=A0A1J8PFC1_9AGAM|nr:hypothetical protein AZE42_01862 [Rhizopogon vesiculosus]
MNTNYHCRFDQQQRKYIFAAVAAVIICAQAQAIQLVQEPTVASTAAWMNLQASIDRLTDTLITSLTTTDESRTADERARAQQSMEEEEGLSDDEKLTVMHVFMRNQAVCHTYLQVMPELRLAFLKSTVKQVSNMPEMAL